MKISLHESRLLTSLFNPQKLGGEANCLCVIQLEGEVTGLLCSDDTGTIVYTMNKGIEIAKETVNTMGGWHLGSLMKLHADGKTIAATGFCLEVNLMVNEGAYRITIDSQSKGVEKHSEIVKKCNNHNPAWLHHLTGLQQVAISGFHINHKIADVMKKLSSGTKYVVTYSLMEDSKGGKLLLARVITKENRVLGVLTAISHVECSDGTKTPN